MLIDFSINKKICYEKVIEFKNSNPSIQLLDAITVHLSYVLNVISVYIALSQLGV